MGKRRGKQRRKQVKTTIYLIPQMNFWNTNDTMCYLLNLMHNVYYGCSNCYRCDVPHYEIDEIDASECEHQEI